MFRFKVCFLVCLFIFRPLALADGSSKNLVDRVKRAVVIVTTYDNEGKPLLQGSGFFITHNRIITNLHVINGAYKAKIRTYDGETYSVQGKIATDKDADLALLQVNPPKSKVSILSFGRNIPSKEEKLIVVSNPIGSPWTVSEGKAVKIWNFARFGQLIQMTASISQGSSGGPVVVGIAALRIKSAEELNFAIPGERIIFLIPGPLSPLLGETIKGDSNSQVSGKASKRD
jgi:serine protease Do